MLVKFTAVQLFSMSNFIAKFECNFAKTNAVSFLLYSIDLEKFISKLKTRKALHS